MFFLWTKWANPFFATNNCVGCFDCKSKPIQGIAVNFTILFPCSYWENIWNWSWCVRLINRSTNFGRLRIIKELTWTKDNIKCFNQLQISCKISSFPARSRPLRLPFPYPEFQQPPPLATSLEKRGSLSLRVTFSERRRRVKFKLFQFDVLCQIFNRKWPFHTIAASLKRV